MKCLTITTKQATYEVHLLNVGDVFEGFGGSKHPLVAGHDFATGNKSKKPTASLVVREISPMTLRDKEWEITAPEFWEWMAKLIRDTSGEVEAVAGPEQ